MNVHCNSTIVLVRSVCQADYPVVRLLSELCQVYQRAPQCMCLCVPCVYACVYMCVSGYLCGTGFTCDISVLYPYLDLYMVSVWIPVFLISVILCDTCEIPFVCDICVVPISPV